LCGIAVFQVAGGGGLSYYFWKAALAGQTILLAVVAPDIAAAIHRLVLRVASTGSSRRVLEGTTVAVLALMGLGATAGQPAVITALAAPWSMSSWAGQQDLAAEVLSTSTLATSHSLATSIWVRESDAYAPALPDQWLHTLTRTRTVHVADYQFTLNEARYGGREALADVGEEVIRNSGLTVLVSDPWVFDELVARLDPASHHRVVLLS
jgi:hypothetical protein